MKRTFMPAACGLVLAGALAASSCGEDYPPYNRLEGLRVLAIQSEPVAPAFGQTTVLKPLVGAAAGEAISYAWSWCPFAGPASANAPCLLPEAALRALVTQAAGPDAATLVPPYDLGTNDTATFTNNIPSALLESLCKGQLPAVDAGVAPNPGTNMDGGVPPELPPIDCANGFPVQIKMVATTPTDSVTTIRTLNLTYDPAALPNTNPVISDLTAQLLLRDEDRDPKVPGDQFEGPPQALNETVPITAIRQREIRLRVAVTPESSEPSKDKNERDEIVDSKERLYLSWFIDSGTTRDERTGFIDGKTQLVDALKNIWRPASVKKFPGTQSKVVVVVRDNRGGVAWTWGIANLVEGPL